MRSGLLPHRDLMRGTRTSKAHVDVAEMVNWRVMATMFRNLHSVMTTPDWAAQLGTRFGISTHGPLGFAALSAPNLRTSFQVIAEYMAVRTTAISCSLSFAERSARIRLHDQGEDTEAFNWLSEMIFKNFETMAATQLGHEADHRINIHLARTRPRDHRKLAQAFRAKLVFSGGENAIEFPADLVHQPSVLHDEPVYRASIEKCVEILARRAQRFSAAAAVRQALQKHFDGAISQRVIAAPPPSLDELAQNLHLTSRTLIRRLDAEGTAYKKILEELRRDYSCSLLCDARLTVADVGERLGYREPANFGRAFRNWFGTSPAAWRRQ